MTNVVETCLNFVRSSFKATSGESLKPGRPDAFELPIALHGSETTKIALNQAQAQVCLLFLARLDCYYTILNIRDGQFIVSTNIRPSYFLWKHDVLHANNYVKHWVLKGLIFL